MKTNGNGKEETTEDRIISFLQHNNLMYNPEYPNGHVHKPDYSSEFWKLADLLNLIGKNEDLDNVTGIAYTLLHSVELERRIYQTCLQILTGALDQEGWATEAFKETKDIVRIGNDMDSDRLSKQLFEILKQDKRCITK